MVLDIGTGQIPIALIERLTEEDGEIPMLLKNVGGGGGIMNGVARNVFDDDVGSATVVLEVVDPAALVGGGAGEDGYRGRNCVRM